MPELMEVEILKLFFFTDLFLSLLFDDLHVFFTIFVFLYCLFYCAMNFMIFVVVFSHLLTMFIRCNLCFRRESTRYSFQSLLVWLL